MIIRIFIIEDDFIFTGILSQTLDQLAKKYKEKQIEIVFQTFYSAKEASFELGTKPDIILLDYYIVDDDLQPETAEVFFEKVKLNDKEVKIIIVSGQGSPSVKQKLLDSGVHAYISKSPEALLELEPTIEAIIEKKISDSRI